MWAASQVHLHRPGSVSKQQSRSVMTGCCCQRAACAHTNPHTAAQSVITQEDICTHRQTRSLLSKQGLMEDCEISFCPFRSVRHFCTSLLFAGQNSSCAVTQTAPDMSAKPADLGNDGRSKGQAKFRNKKECKPDWSFFPPYHLCNSLLSMGDNRLTST